MTVATAVPGVPPYLYYENTRARAHTQRVANSVFPPLPLCSPWPMKMCRASRFFFPPPSARYGILFPADPTRARVGKNIIFRQGRRGIPPSALPPFLLSRATSLPIPSRFPQARARDRKSSLRRGDIFTGRGTDTRALRVNFDEYY